MACAAHRIFPQRQAGRTTNQDISMHLPEWKVYRLHLPSSVLVSHSRFSRVTTLKVRVLPEKRRRIHVMEKVSFLVHTRTDTSTSGPAISAPHTAPGEDGDLSGHEKSLD